MSKGSYMTVRSDAATTELLLAGAQLEGKRKALQSSGSGSSSSSSGMSTGSCDICLGNSVRSICGGRRAAALWWPGREKVQSTAK
jgi:hypothetical protein